MVFISSNKLPANINGIPQQEITNSSIAITTAGTLNVSDTVSQNTLNSLSTKLDTLATKLDTLETTLTEIAPRQAVSAVYTASSLASSGISTVIDTDDYSFMTICGSQSSSDLPLEIQYSINNSNWFKVRSKVLTFAAYEGGSWADDVLIHPMRYIRFVNTSGSTITNLYLSYQLSN